MNQKNGGTPSNEDLTTSGNISATDALAAEKRGPTWTMPASVLCLTENLT